MNEQPTSSIRIFISVREWHHIVEWMRLSLKCNEREAMGHFLLECRGSSRTWVATDSAQLVVLECDGPAPVGLDEPTETFSVLVNSRFFRGHDPHDATLVIEQFEDGRIQTMHSDGYEVVLAEHPGTFPDWRSAVASVAGTEVRVETDRLLGAISICNVVPAGLEPPTPVVAWFSGADGRLRLDTPWASHPNTRVTIQTDLPVPDTEPVLVAVYRLGQLLMAVEDDHATITLPTTPRGAVGIAAGDYRAVLMPVDRWGEERIRLQDLLCEFLGTESVFADDEGDYLLETKDGSSIWVRLHTEALPISVQVFSVLASGVEPSPELFEELNSINANAAYVKVIWASGSVMAETDIVAEALDMAELSNALEVVRETAERYRGLLSVYFGADVDEPASGDETDGKDSADST